MEHLRSLRAMISVAGVNVKSICVVFTHSLAQLRVCFAGHDAIRTTSTAALVSPNAPSVPRTNRLSASIVDSVTS